MYYEYKKTLVFGIKHLNLASAVCRITVGTNENTAAL